ncbi:VCBS repeat-containing protein [Phytohabitans rumicis]|uniref:Uncharacterized protein n=1 Tax=Phytohabitans rumicis TaxID=1076125 RepID=A0A6V8L1R5_9ACTN|nr:VCBS repeat-containing protein [Phytohabitans rumicis]GFJ86665.1 hypothetical protein Prum_003070 [Phytohabitans rumicis]
MSTYAEHTARRDQSRAAAREVERVEEALRAARDELARLLTQVPPNARAILAVQRRISQLTIQLGAARAAAGATRHAYEAGLDALPASLDPAVPLLLLPVRLETRIRARTDGAAGDELVVRVYPDDVHLDAHDPRLTAAEVQLGRHYWRQRWAVEAGAAPDAEQQSLAAWRQLTGRLGPARAAWVARVLTPANLPPTAGAEPDLPDPPVRQPGDERAVLAAALPDRWVVRVWRGGARLGEARGELIPRPLVAGPPTDEAGSPQSWLTELPAAIDAGMAVVVRPDTPTAIDRVDVTAFGVRATDTAAEAAGHLRDLLDAHQFAPRLGGVGLDLVPQGTPTNNTPAARALARTDPSSGRSAAAWTGRPVAARGDGSDADLLAAALGLPDRDPRHPGDSDRFVLGRLEHAAGADQRDVAAMAAVTWPASWGYFLRQFLSGVEGIEADADLGGWRRFVLDTVRGRGPLPALRVGDQPYGVLPVLPSDRWRPWPDQPELFAVTLNLAGGIAEAWLLVSWDLDARGAWTGGWVGPAPLPIDAGTDGLAAGAGDLDGDGHAELVVLTTRRAGDAVYQVGQRLDEDGVPGLWTGPHPLPPPAPGRTLIGGAAGVAVASLKGRPSLVTVTQEQAVLPFPAPSTVVRVVTDLAPTAAAGAGRPRSRCPAAVPACG